MVSSELMVSSDLHLYPTIVEVVEFKHYFKLSGQCIG